MLKLGPEHRSKDMYAKTNYFNNVQSFPKQKPITSFISNSFLSYTSYSSHFPIISKANTTFFDQINCFAPENMRFPSKQEFYFFCEKDRVLLRKALEMSEIVGLSCLWTLGGAPEQGKVYKSQLFQ